MFEVVGAARVTGAETGLLCANALMQQGTFFDAARYDRARSQARFEPSAELAGQTQAGAPRHQVYNFEVEGTHTYIAGGVRVHNHSALSYRTPGETILEIDLNEDENGRVDWYRASVDGGLGEVYVDTQLDENGETESVTKDYVYLSASGERVQLIQRDFVEKIDGIQTVVGSEIQFADLDGSHLGESIATSFSPFLAEVLASNTLSQLAVETLLDTVLGNFGEFVGGAIHHSLLEASTNLDSLAGLGAIAFGDIDADFLAAGTDNVISLVSRLIVSEIFENGTTDDLASSVAESLLTGGVDYLLSGTADYVLNDVLSAGININVSGFDPVSLIAAGAVRSFLDPQTTLAGSVAESSATALASTALSLVAGLSTPFVAVFAPLVGNILGSFVGSFFEADEDQYSFWTTDFVFPDGTYDSGRFATIQHIANGGNPHLSGQATSAYVDILNIIVDQIGARSHNFLDVREFSIGHYNSGIQIRILDGDPSTPEYVGTYSDIQSALNHAVLFALRDMNINDGDLKVVRALNGGYFDVEVDQTIDEVIRRIDVARAYQTYLENSEAINLLIYAGTPEGAQWIEALRQAQLMGLDGGYVVEGDIMARNIFTADGADWISGGAGANSIRSYGGNDTVFGGEGDDLIDSGTGADVVRAGIGADILFGGDGNDFLAGQDGNDHHEGGAGDDLIHAGNGNDIAYGGANRDNIYGEAGADNLFGGDGNDDLRGGIGADSLSGGDGDDLIGAGDGHDVIYGGDGNDTINGGAGVDGIEAGAGNDLVLGGDDVDIINGNDGDDALYGGNVADTIFGGDGDDFISGGDQDQAFSLTTRASDHFGYNTDWRVEYHEREVEDVDGDGRADIVAFGSWATHTSFGTEDGIFSDPQIATIGYHYDQGWRTELHEREVADVNGDGRADIVGFGSHATYVSLGQVNGTFGAAIVATTAYDYDDLWRTEYHERRVGDVNGDGRADIVGFGHTGTYVSFGQADGSFSGAIVASTGFDYDDLWRTENHVRRLGDVNGDGRSDVVGFGHDGTYVALGQANGTFGTAILASTGFDYEDLWRTELHEREVEDVDGDGRADIVGFGHDGTYVALGQADGTFGMSFRASVNFSYEDLWRTEYHERKVGDVNDDGFADVVGFNHDGVYVSLWKNGDELFGGAGNDTLQGNSGDDWLTGDSGADIFLFEAGSGADTILDFEDGVDVITIAGEFQLSNVVIVDTVKGSQIQFGADTIDVLNVTAADIQDDINLL